MFRNLTSSIGGLFDSNPQKTMQDQQVKLRAAVEQMEKDADQANSDLVKASETILHEYDYYNHEKGALLAPAPGRATRTHWHAHHVGTCEAGGRPRTG